MLNVANKPFMLNVTILSAVMPSVVMLNVVAPSNLLLESLVALLGNIYSTGFTYDDRNMTIVICL